MAPGSTQHRAAPAPETPRARPAPERGSPNAAPPTARDLFRADATTYAPAYDRPARSHFGQPWISRGYRHVGGGSYAITDPYVANPFVVSGFSRTGDFNRTRIDPEPRGYLRLLVYPTTAQVYVDGYFVGIVDDARTFFRGLEAGPHRIELREAGFESVTLDVRIVAGETITYRKDLVRIDETAAPVRPTAAPASVKTFYVIPGCYAGDRPPDAARLPRGCNVAAVKRQ